jgi:hypothetical protein
VHSHAHAQEREGNRAAHDDAADTQLSMFDVLPDAKQKAKVGDVGVCAL